MASGRSNGCRKYGARMRWASRAAAASPDSPLHIRPGQADIEVDFAIAPARNDNLSRKSMATSAAWVSSESTMLLAYMSWWFVTHIGPYCRSFLSIGSYQHNLLHKTIHSNIPETYIAVFSLAGYFRGGDSDLCCHFCYPIEVAVML